MNEEQAFLATILANPADDTVRLVYADWLQEHDQEDRAEFIRLQIEMGQLPCVAVAEIKLLQTRCDVLLNAHGDEWTPPANAIWGWRWGFVDEIASISAADWLKHAEAITSIHPLRKVGLASLPEVVAKTATDLLAPSGWCVGYSLGGKWWDWESLGEPTIEPEDSLSLALLLLEKEFPPIVFHLAPAGRLGRIVNITREMLFNDPGPILDPRNILKPGGA